MKILSLDTAMAACSAAVIDTQQPLPLAAAFRPMERGHAEALPPMVAEVMRIAGLHFSEIDRIIVTTGPGTFTGVRIGLAFARGLGLSRGTPVIGIDSLSAIAANERAQSPLLVVCDARNEEVYAACFDAARNVAKLPHVTTASGAAALAPAGSIVIGSAAAAVVAASGRSDLALSLAGDLPIAERFAAMAVACQPDDMPSPLYLRAPDAKPQDAPLRKLRDLSIEHVGPEASTLLSELHGEVFDEGWSSASFSEMLSSPGAEALLAVEHNEPLGFLVTRTAADESEVITIGTRPSRQRRGVAQTLLNRQLAALAARGVAQVFLEVASSNLSAQALYRASGFSEAGRRKAYYLRRDGMEDAIVMRRILHP